MRIFFGMTGQFGMGGLVQQSVLLIKHLRRLGCEVLPMVGGAPPHNDEMKLEELGYCFEAFNVVDYALIDVNPLLRLIGGWYARRQIAIGDPQKLRATYAEKSGELPLDINPMRVLRNMFYHPGEQDIEKFNKLRLSFQPDIEYACELSMMGWFGQAARLPVPLVTAAQGYEVVQRMGLDLRPLIRQHEALIDAVISGSEANVRENIAMDLPELLDRTRVVPYGIEYDDAYQMSDAEARDRAQRLAPRGEDEFVITILSRVDVEKGTDLALHALRIMRDAGVPARLRIVGDGLVTGAHYRSTIDSKIGMLDIADYVDLVGFVAEKADKIALLKTSDAFLAGFIKSEPFGLVLCEAMGSGLPVVAPNSGAAPEILNWDGRESGLLYRTNDTGQMADRLADLYHHPELRLRLGTNGRAAVERHFNARVMAERVLRVMEAAVRRRHDREALRFRLEPAAELVGTAGD